jgi:hypothetical protein
MKQRILLLLLLVTTTLTLYCQTRQPFSKIGKKVKVITLSNGKYDEFFDEDSLQRIGSSVININTKKITKIKLTQEEINELENTQASRFLSIDPLAKEYSWLTPYQYAANSPISGIDLDGLEYRYYMINLISNNKGDIVTVKPTASRVEDYVVHKMETIIGTTIEVKLPRFNETWVAEVGFYSYKFESLDKMQRAVDALKDPKVLAASKECHCLPGANLAHTTQAEEQVGNFLQGLGNAAAAGVMAGQGLNGLSGIAKTILKKSDRLKIFTTRLGSAKPAANQEEAIKLINKTLDNVEDEFSGIIKAKGIPNRDDGRMYGILDEKYITTLEDGTKIARTKGNRIILNKDGGFQIQTKDGSETLFTKAGAPKN